MSVHKDKNGKWYVKYKNKTKRGFATKKEAERYEAQMTLENNSRNIDMTFDMLAKDYLNYRKSNVSYGTYNKYKRTYEKHICNLFPVDTKMKDITKMMCRKFAESLGNCELSTTTKNAIITEFKSIFKHGNQYFDIADNPSSAIDRFKKTYDDLLKDKEKEIRVWTIEEFEMFIKEVDMSVYRVLFIVLFYTGMRLGEAMALKWKDYSNGVFDVYKSITYKTDKTLYEEKQPKNSNSIRKVAVSQNIASIIDNYKKEEMSKAGFKESWYMFGRNRPLAQSSIDRHKNAACKSAGVKQIRIHDFRHSHVSYLISRGVNIVLVSRRIGHADVNMTLRAYTHMFKNDEAGIMELLDKSSQNLLN